ncbi:hypothetical protein, partial [Isoptericola sp. NPDC057191]|uniref:hypothetical protein n=1 Tax=Isoptericola sp. NPDC057191 TaxID=3346041 RepID=UPI0036414C72
LTTRRQRAVNVPGEPVKKASRPPSGRSDATRPGRMSDLVYVVLTVAFFAAVALAARRRSA